MTPRRNGATTRKSLCNSSESGKRPHHQAGESNDDGDYDDDVVTEDDNDESYHGSDFSTVLSSSCSSLAEEDSDGGIKKNRRKLTRVLESNSLENRGFFYSRFQNTEVPSGKDDDYEDRNYERLLEDFQVSDNEEFDEFDDVPIRPSRKKKRVRRNNFVERKGKIRTAARESELPEEARTLLEQANDAYLDRRVNEAVALLEALVKKAPGLHDPFHLLGAIYEEELDQPEKAADCYFIAAQLLGDDPFLWRRVAFSYRKLGNLQRAIYCFERCVKVCDGGNAPLDEDSAFALACCHLSAGQLHKAAKWLGSLFRIHQDDVFLGRELAKCYYRLGKRENAVLVLESCISAELTASELEEIKSEENKDSLLLYTIQIAADAYEVYDPHTVNMLSELYTEEGQFEKCDLLLSKFLRPETIDQGAADLVVKLAVAHLHLNKGLGSFAVQRAMKVLTEVPRQEFADLFIKLADAFYNRGFAREALNLYMEVAAFKTVRAEALIWVKIARCRLSLERGTAAPDAEASLEKCLTESDVTTRKGLVWKKDTLVGSNSRLILTKVLRRMSHHAQRDQLVMNFSEWEELKKPLDKQQRLDLFASLQQRLGVILKICNSPDVGSTDSDLRRLWIEDFLLLVQDSELDRQRALQIGITKKLARTTLDVETQSVLLAAVGVESEGDSMPAATDTRPKRTGVTHATIKQSMGLVSLEDFLGWRDFAFFLETGVAVVMRSAGMQRMGVELLEAVLANKRMVRAQQLDLGRREFIAKLKRLSLILSIDQGLYRVALSYIREQYLNRPDNANRTIQALGRILFCGTFSHSTIGGISSSTERSALLENRAWCVRQLLQRPHSFPLTLLTAHFCSLSGRWPLAVKEYSRAHRLSPSDDLTTLCLAVSYLNLSTSRNVLDRHSAVVQGLALMRQFKRQRMKTAHLAAEALQSQASRFPGVAAEVWDAIRQALLNAYEAETEYNLGRAFHHLNVVRYAFRLYLNCVRIIGDLQRLNDWIKLVGNCAHLPQILTWDLPSIRCCALYNLSLISRWKKDYEQAVEFSSAAIVWGD